MYSKFLLPHRFKLVGICLLIPATVGLLLYVFAHFEIPWLNFPMKSNIRIGSFVAGQTLDHNFTVEVLCELFIIGGLLTGFSREKIEDEYTTMIRYFSLALAVVLHYLFLSWGIASFYNLQFFTFQNYNMFTILIIFLISLHIMLYRHYKRQPNEKQASYSAGDL